VAEYLVAEMLDRQPADVQQLLLRTSLLDRVNGELADLLTGRPGSERILLDLEDANAFALDSDLRAVALMNLGIVEAWSAALPDAERHLREGAVLARRIGRPYLEVACLAQLGFASKIRPFGTTRRLCREAIGLAEPDRLVLPFVMTGSAGLLETLPRHETAHAALLADILDVAGGSSPTAADQSPSPHADELSPSELRVLRYLPTNLSRPEIASELSVPT